MDIIGLIELVTSKLRKRTNIVASECAIAAADGSREGTIILRCLLENKSDIPVSITSVVLKIGDAYSEKAHLKSRRFSNISSDAIPVTFSAREAKMCYFLFSARTKGISSAEGRYSVCPDIPNLLFQTPVEWAESLSFSTLLSMLPSREVPVELELSTTCRQQYIPAIASVRSYDTL